MEVWEYLLLAVPVAGVQGLRVQEIMRLGLHQVLQKQLMVVQGAQEAQMLLGWQALTMEVQVQVQEEVVVLETETPEHKEKLKLFMKESRQRCSIRIYLY